MNIIECDKNGVTLFVLEGRIDTEGTVDMDRLAGRGVGG